MRFKHVFMDRSCRTVLSLQAKLQTLHNKAFVLLKEIILTVINLITSQILADYRILIWHCELM